MKLCIVEVSDGACSGLEQWSKINTKREGKPGVRKERDQREAKEEMETNTSALVYSQNPNPFGLAANTHDSHKAMIMHTCLPIHH